MSITSDSFIDSTESECNSGSNTSDNASHILHVKKESSPIVINMNPTTQEQLEIAVAQLKLQWSQDKTSLKAPAIPTPPLFPKNSVLSVPSKLKKIQQYLWKIQYNHIGSEFVAVEKKQALCRIMALAKFIMKEALPIKCLEAVVIGMYLTKDLLEIIRFPLRFKSRCNGNSYWHIVLCVRYNNKYGTIGLSRRNILDYRPLEYDSLSEIVLSFKEAYEQVGHKVRIITVGLPFGRDEHSREIIYWHYLHMTVKKGRIMADSLLPNNIKSIFSNDD